MAMERIGSVNAYKTQSVQPAPQPKGAAEKPASEYTDGTAQVSPQAADTNTTVVSRTVDKGEQNNSQQQVNTQQQNEQIRKAVEQINKKMYNSEAVFGVHDATNRITIKIVDKESKEVIKEYPPEKTLDMIAKVWELAGILVDEKR